MTYYVIQLLFIICFQFYIYNKNTYHCKILRQNRKPVAYKLQKDEVKYILKFIENDKTITMSDLLNSINLKQLNKKQFKELLLLYIVYGDNIKNIISSYTQKLEVAQGQSV